MSGGPLGGDRMSDPYGTPPPTDQLPQQGFGQPVQGWGGGQQAQHHQHQQPMPGGGHQPPLQLSIEEQRVLRECNSESFWYRSLPLGAVLATFAHVAQLRGILRPSPRFGTGPKVVAASILGYFLGKFTYAEKCADKFLIQAPRSNIAQAIRVRRGIAPLETESVELSPGDSELSSGAGSQPLPSAYTGTSESEPIPPVAPSYDQLRKLNREMSVSPAPPPPRSIPPPPPAYQPPPPEGGLYRPVPLPPKSSNKYGDEGFE